MNLSAATVAAVIAAAPTAASSTPAASNAPAAEVDDQDADIAARTEDGSYIFENDVINGESLGPDGSILVQRPSARFKSMIDIRGHFIPELISRAYDL